MLYQPPITTVVAAASSYDLTTLENVHQELDIKDTDQTKDAFLARAISQSSAAIARWCNRVFAVETVQDLLYRRRDWGSAWRSENGFTIQLSRWPVVEITSIVETDQDGNTTALVADTDYKLNAALGTVERLDSTNLMPLYWSAPLVTAIYGAGYDPIPDDIEEACLRLVTARFKARGRDPFLRSEGDPGVGQQTWWVGPVPGQNGALPPEIEALVNPYRVPVAA